MTDERKQYLASISKEEREIRFAIATEKSVIKLCKDGLDICNSSISLNADKNIIAKEKIILKALKKQLPAPAEMEYDQEYICPICNTITQAPYKSMREMFYCPYCGQKLR